MMRSNYRKWSEYPYQGETVPPRGDSQAGYWPMFFFKRESASRFIDPFGRPIQWQIKNPLDIDWQAELQIVEQTMNTITPQQIERARYWATGEFTAKFSRLIYELGTKYPKGSPSIARMQGFYQATMNDVFVISWYLKYLWDVSRPNQYGRNFRPVLDTPYFPAYPSAHAVIAGASEVIIGYFFPQEAANLKSIAEDAALSRLFAGVHFKADNDEGLRLGRQIGGYVVELMRGQNINL
ncbi:MAG: vanadium-dependent haloperoxidase [Bacillota bacterium]